VKVFALPLPTEIVVAAGAVGNVLVALLDCELDEAEAVVPLDEATTDFVPELLGGPPVQTVFVNVSTVELQD